MRVIGVDPGKNTGYAVLEIGEDGMVIEHMSIHEDSPADCARRTGRLLMGSERLVVERFVPRWGQAFDCTPMYLIGALQGRYNEEINLVLPATHKGLVPKERLTALMKSQGYKVGAGHSRDALSVAVYYAAFVLREPTVLEFLADNKQEEK